MADGDAIAELYSAHYRPLVRWATLFVRDEPTAEDVVQECFAATCSGRYRLRDDRKALAYLRRTVANRATDVIRHRAVMEANTPEIVLPDVPSAEQEAMVRLERRAVIGALRTLPPRRREAVVLRYYGGLRYAQIAARMGISEGAAKSHIARGTASLRTVLGRRLWRRRS